MTFFRLILPALLLATAVTGRAEIPAAPPASATVPPPSLAVPAPAPVNPFPVAAPVDPAKEAKIRQLFQLLGLEAQMKEVASQKIAAMRKSSPQFSPEFWDAFQARFNTDELLGLLVPVYDKYYTKDDLDGVIAFYQSPLGKKVLVAVPQINADVRAVSKAWAEAKVQQAIQELKQKAAAAPSPAQ